MIARFFLASGDLGAGLASNSARVENLRSIGIYPSPRSMARIGLSRLLPLTALTQVKVGE
jgi:hypothetical protein